ncbi:IS5/IS1182 family transposase, partial [Vibrio fluvialis]|nr:IS5/IS1182 family transposase [Vibrio fluvialis]
LLGGRLNLQNYNAQVGEAYAMLKALNKLTGLGMPKLAVLVDAQRN